MSDQFFISQNPATGEAIGRYQIMDLNHVEEICVKSRQAFEFWRRSGFSDRAMLLRKMAAILREKNEEYSWLISLEMGKPVVQALAEIEKCAMCCDYYAEHGESLLRQEVVAVGEGVQAYVTYEPLGVILAVMPWNFPFWQVFRFLVPAFMAGNAALLKHASNVSGCALAIEEVCRLSGVPENLFRTLIMPSGAVASLIAKPQIAAVSLTGSTQAGRSVAEIAGRHLKKCVLELGGSDPYVILSDANLQLAARICAYSRCLNTGQSCIAAKRFIVVEEVYPEFMKLFLAEMRSYTFDDPLKSETKMGPLARIDLRDELDVQVQKSVALGARIILGGEKPDLAGAFYPATVLENVKPGMPAYDDELFGPVASLIRVKDETEALRVANDSPYGLGGAVFTSDKSRGAKMARHGIEAGNVFVNAFVRSDPRLPFGGIKASGYGRELSSYGIREFTNIKTIWIE